MTSIVINLSDDELQKLKEMATLLGVAPEELARTGIEAMLVNENDEAVLLKIIRQELPPEVEKRYVELNAKRWAENLTPNEHSELLKLIERVEGLQARRIKSLAKLARIRKRTLMEVMESLNIKPRAYE